ncbi:NlpC/P60 family protein [Butyrivibrio sp. MC2013]|uniref:NlpC/P60 family protein n=1 Tax=Butyrivibrio sp. MC2013 TaxID=1280686 RepID=UPI0018C91654|nr:NlpC/P60 family protein [Butyrivibrio sp. MC2013]
MKKKTIVLLYLMLVLMTILGAGLIIEGSSRSINMTRASSVSEDSIDENESGDPVYDLVSCVEGTTPDMLSADHWTSAAENEVLFNQEEIEDFNKNNPAFVYYQLPDQGSRRKLYMDDLRESMDGDIVRALIAGESADDPQQEYPDLYQDGEPVSDAYLEGLYEDMALDMIPATVIPRYAINLNRTTAKIFPTGDKAFDSADDIWFDSFVSAEVMPFSGVVILHESRDGSYSYILNGTYLGWVKTDNLALCSGYDEWKRYSDPERFVVVTGSEIVLDETALDSPYSGMILPMGCRVPLSDDHDSPVGGRSTYGCYTAELPVRDEEGRLESIRVLIPVSKDVSIGYLPMTSANVIGQAFKFLGRVYGYGGELSSNDCSGFARQVYACFGLKLPRNAKAIAEMADLGSINTSMMTTKAKLRLLSQTKPGLPLYMDGHLMIYLGMEEGRPYVISSCATYIAPSSQDGSVEDAYCVFVSGLDLLRKNGKSWLEDLSYIMCREY